MARQRAGKAVTAGIWIAVLVVLAAAAPSAYHAGNNFYQKFHYDSVTANAIKSCDGPVTDTMPSYQQQQVNDCLAKSEDLAKAKSDYAAFTKSEKH